MQDIEVDVTLTGGRTCSCVLPSDSPLLRDLFVSLAAGQQRNSENPGLLLQLPIDDGQAACSFMSTSVLSVITRPPVLIQAQQAQGGGIGRQHAGLTAASGSASSVSIEHFLTPEENRNLLDYALAQEPHFTGSTVTSNDGKHELPSHRKSKVLFGIKDTKWRDVFLNRLKLHLPHILSTLGRDGFVFDSSEIQLTASNDGDFFKAHADADHNVEAVASRVVTFVYYLHKLPKPFSGGDLLLYGDAGGSGHGDGRVTATEPQNNMLVAFLSDRLHEVDIVRCPSKAFSDSRFTVNGWLRSGVA